MVSDGRRQASLVEQQGQGQGVALLDLLKVLLLSSLGGDCLGDMSVVAQLAVRGQLGECDIQPLKFFQQSGLIRRTDQQITLPTGYACHGLYLLLLAYQSSG